MDIDLKAFFSFKTQDAKDKRPGAEESEGHVSERSLNGSPYLLSCHHPTHADRFIGYNNLNLYSFALLYYAQPGSVIGSYTNINYRMYTKLNY